MDREKSVDVPQFNDDRLLDPSLGGTDLSETVEVVRSYVERTGFFTEEDLRAHIESNNIYVPGIRSKMWSSVYDAIQTEVLRHYAEQGEERMWVSMRLGEAMLTGLAVVDSKENLSSSNDNFDDEEDLESEKDLIKGLIGDVFSQSTTLAMKLEDIKADLKYVLEDSYLIEGLDALFEEIINEGYLVKISKGGRKLYEPASQVVSTNKKEKDRNRTEQSKNETYITDEEFEAVLDTINYLARPGSHVTQGETLKSLEQLFGKKLGGQLYRRVMRAVDEQTGIVKVQSKFSRSDKKRRSPKVVIRNQRIKTEWLEYPESWANKLRIVKIAHVVRET